MKKAYLLVYNDRLGSREDVKRFLNGSREVTTWRADIPNSFYVISEVDANTLSKLIRNELGAGRFILSEITSNVGGWLPPQTWYLLNKKALKPK
jgi:hypothetical protein